MDGTLSCCNCSRQYPIVNYVPRFVSSDAYVGSFSFEWEKYPRLLYGFETERSFSRFHMDLSELSGKVILDAGCGSGRFVDLFSKYGEEVVGVDLSFSVNDAFRYCGLRRNVHVLQADLFKLPLRENVFDLVFSFGVLHHTSNTAKAFMQLVKHVKRGGKLAVFVYVKRSETTGRWEFKVKERLSDLCRTVSCRLPRVLLYGLSHLAIPLYDLKKLPKVGRFLDAAIEAGAHPDWRMRVLGTFDWYSPKYQWKHTNAEVLQWFKAAGFTDIFVSTHPVTLVGSKR